VKVKKEREEALLATLLADIQNADDYYEEVVEPDLLRRRRIYKADRDYYREKYPKLSERSDWVCYDVWSMVEQYLPPVMQGLFGGDNVVSIVGRGMGDQEKADVMSELIQYQLMRENKGYLLFKDVLTDAISLNLGLIKAWWSREEDREEFEEVVPLDEFYRLSSSPGVRILKQGELTPMGVPVKWEEIRRKRNAPTIERVKPSELRFNKEARSLDDADFVAHRRRVSVDYLRRRAKSGTYDAKKTEEAIESSRETEFTTYELTENPQLQDESFQGDDPRRKVVIYECYLKFDLDGDGLLEDVIATVCNGQLLRVVENPYERHLFFAFMPVRDPDKVWSNVGFADISGEIQDVNVAIIRQLLVNVSLNNNPVNFIDETRVNMRDLLGAKAFVRVQGKPGEAVQPQSIQPIAAWTMPILELLETKHEKWTGRTRYDQGIAQGTSLNKTATGVSLMMGAANQRVQDMIRTFAETTVVELMRFLVKLNQTYVDQPMVFRLTDRVLSIAPDDVDGDLDLEVNVSVGMGSKQETIQNLQFYLASLHPSGMQLGACSPVNWIHAAKKLMNEAGIKDTEPYFSDPQMMPMGGVHPGAGPGQPPTGGGAGQTGPDLSGLPPAVAGKIAGGNIPGAGSGGSRTGTPD
jgi:hypothetical protein